MGWQKKDRVEVKKLYVDQAVALDEPPQRPEEQLHIQVHDLSRPAGKARSGSYCLAKLSTPAVAQLLELLDSGKLS